MNVLILLFLFCSQAYSLEISVEKVQHQFVLNAGKCDDLREEVNSIMLWTSGTSADGDVIRRPETNSINGRCSTRIEDIVPKFLKRLHKINIHIDGPNCYSSIFIDLGIIKNPRHVSSMELRHWIESDFCTPLKSNQKPAPGDIAIVRQNASFFSPGFSVDSHGMVFVTENLVFTKDSMAQDTSYALEPFNQSAHVQKLNPKCINFYGTSAPSFCENYLSYFRCDRKLVNKVLSWPGIDKDYNELRKKIASIELQSLAATKEAHPVALDKISDELTQIKSKISQKTNELSNKKLDSNSIELLQL